MPGRALESGTFGNKLFIEYASTHAACALAFFTDKHGEIEIEDPKTGKKEKRCKFFQNVNCADHLATGREIRDLDMAGKFERRGCPSTYLLDANLKILWMHPEDSCGVPKLREAIEEAQKKLGKGLVGESCRKFREAADALEKAMLKKDWRKACAGAKVMNDESKGVPGAEALAISKLNDLDVAALEYANELIPRVATDGKAAQNVRDLILLFPESSKTGAAARAAIGPLNKK